MGMDLPAASSSYKLFIHEKTAAGKRAAEAAITAFLQGGSPYTRYMKDPVTTYLPCTWVVPCDNNIVYIIEYVEEAVV